MGAVLAGIDACGCAAPVVPDPAPPPLAAARVAWQARVNAHETHLALTLQQRAGLTHLLLGSRSLWSFTADELRALAAGVEAFGSAAALQAALDAAGWQPGDPDTWG